MRSAYELNEDYERQLAVHRAEIWKTGDRTQLLAKVRQLAGIHRLEELPKPKVENLGSLQRTGYRIEKLLLRPEEGLVLPALQFIPKEPKAGQAAIYLHEDGKAADAGPGGAIERLLQAGTTVLAVDLPGMGQTKAASDSGDGYTAYRDCVAGGWKAVRRSTTSRIARAAPADWQEPQFYFWK